MVFLYLLIRPTTEADNDQWHTLHVFHFAEYIKLITAGVSLLFVLLSWPTGPNATGNAALELGGDAGEFFALMLLSITGVFLVAGTNDIILLFLGIELASIPTYIMVSISRPLPVAQEAGVKYFFLGAMAAAIMLFGFSYLYGTTGQTQLDSIMRMWHPHNYNSAAAMTSWQMLAVLMVLAGFAFKVAAVPMHEYAGDVYQGAATPLTALLAFIPKISGIVAIIKILYVAAGPKWIAPDVLIKLMWVLAILTMSVGNVLGLLQVNIKRVMAYSSVAHTGYMFVGLTALLAAKGSPDIQRQALLGVLFYITAYGIMNAGVFGVLMLLPARGSTRYGTPGTLREMPPTAGAAETYEDIAGQGANAPRPRTGDGDLLFQPDRPAAHDRFPRQGAADPARLGGRQGESGLFRSDGLAGRDYHGERRDIGGLLPENYRNDVPAARTDHRPGRPRPRQLLISAAPSPSDWRCCCR